MASGNFVLMIQIMAFCLFSARPLSDQCWFVVYWTLTNNYKPHWNLNLNINSFNKKIISFKKKMSCVKWQPLCFGLNVLIIKFLEDLSLLSLFPVCSAAEHLSVWPAGRQPGRQQLQLMRQGHTSHIGPPASYPWRHEGVGLGCDGHGTRHAPMPVGLLHGHGDPHPESYHNWLGWHISKSVNHYWLLL